MKLLIKNKKTLAIAESCSGGLLSHRLTNIPGSSKFFKCGLVVYSNESKSKLLKISPLLLAKHGAVSAEVAQQMAQNIRKFFRTDIGIAITGIAGPGGAQPGKPVGLTFIAINSLNKKLKAEDNRCLQCLFRGKRLQIKNQAATTALKLFLKFL